MKLRLSLLALASAGLLSACGGVGGSYCDTDGLKLTFKDGKIMDGAREAGTYTTDANIVNIKLSLSAGSEPREIVMSRSEDGKELNSDIFQLKRCQ